MTAGSDGSAGPPGLLAPRRLDVHPRALVVAVIVNVVLGAVAVALATAVFPIHPAMNAWVAVPGIDPRMVGLAIWTVACLASSVLQAVDRQVFCTGPIMAAALLGGPAAGAWVALLGTFDRRELRGQVPWHGVLSNHGQLAWSGMVAGVLMLVIRQLPGQVNQVVDLAAMLIAALVFLGANQGTAILIYRARTGRAVREAFEVVSRADWNAASMAETCVAFLAALAYWAHTWWAPALIVAVNAVTSRSMRHQQSTWLLRHNQISGLPNALALTEHGLVLSKESPPPEKVRVLYVDLDGFKQVNDVCGHQAGDEVLAVVGGRLAAAARPELFVAHLHGDEFAILVTDADEDICDRLAEEVRRVVEEPVVAIPQGGPRISASVGHAAVPDCSQLRAPLHEADQRMQAQKTERAIREGRDRRTA